MYDDQFEEDLRSGNAQDGRNVEEEEEEEDERIYQLMYEEYLREQEEI